MINNFVGKGYGKNKFLYRLWQIYFRLIHPKYAVVRGFKLSTDNSKDYIISSYYYDNFEKKEFDLFSNVIKEGDVVVDCGSYIGFYSLEASTKVGKTGKVYAFEPHPKNFEITKKNIELNNFTNTICENKAVSNHTGKSFLSEAEINTEHHLADKGIEVHTIKLDDYFKNLGYKVDVLKIDVEGTEMDVLNGAKKIMKNNPHIKIFLEVTLSKDGSIPGDIKNFIEKNKFKVEELNFNGWQKDFFLERTYFE